jgi:DNA-binding transcriptional ArsR family regulator
MIKVKMAEVSSRLGSFTIIKLGQTVLISPCDTRVKILEAFSREPLTGEELTRETGLSYSAVMDHMDLLERVGLVNVSLKRGEGGDGKRKRRVFRFHLREDPLEALEALFLTTKTGQVPQEPIAV